MQTASRWMQKVTGPCFDKRLPQLGDAPRIDLENQGIVFFFNGSLEPDQLADEIEGKRPISPGP
jgi:hypothetical protein